MTLMFGNLTLAFVRFGTAIQNAFAPGAGPEAMQEFNNAADEFKALLQ
jgi:ATP-binding cassette subfamily B (MDR/TAP) protein 1